MVAWTAWLLPIVAVLLLGAAATYFVRMIRLPQEETAAGIAALAAMRWRDYIHLVLAALNRRGYERIFDPRATTVDENEYQLERDGQAWLLSSKHGTAYVLGSTAIAEFANRIRMRGAGGGLLVTSGHFAPEAKPLALAQRIELLDGPTLWPELRELLSPEERASIAASAQARAKRRIVGGWIGALVIGIALFAYLRPDASPDASVSRVAGPAEVAPVASPKHVAAPANQDKSVAARPAIADTPGVPPVASATPATTTGSTAAKELDRRREAAAQAISTLPSVDRALWSTQSTLLVYLLDDSVDPKAQICRLLEQYDELAASRIQLDPPAGSNRAVRFVQCRFY